MKIRKVKDFILDKKSLSGFCVLLILYNNLILRLINPSLSYHVGNELFLLIIAIWMLIQLFDDLVHKRLLDTQFKLVFGLFYLYAAIVFLFNRPYNIPGMIYITYFFVMWYILTSASLYSSKEEFFSFLQKIFLHFVIVVLIINTISLIAYFLLGFRIVSKLPACFVLTGNNHAKTSIFGRLLKFRYGGLYSIVPEAGFFSYVSFAITLYLRENNVLKKPITLFSIVTSGMMVFLSNSRISEICLGVIICYWLFWYLRRKKILFFHPTKGKRFISIALIISLLILFVCLYRFGPSVINAIQLDPFTFFDRLSAARLSYWKEGLTAFIEKKWFGHGWGNIVGLSEKRYHYHNIIICMLVFTGIIGTVLFCGLSLYCTIKIHKNSASIEQYKAKWIKVLVLCIYLESFLEVCLVAETSHIETPIFFVGLGLLCYCNLNTPLNDGSFLLK